MSIVIEHQPPTRTPVCGAEQQRERSVSLWNDGSGSLQDASLLCSFPGNSDGDLSVQGARALISPSEGRDKGELCSSM